MEHHSIRRNPSAITTWKCDCKQSIKPLPITTDRCPHCSKPIPKSTRDSIYKQVLRDLTTQCEKEKRQRRQIIASNLIKYVPHLIVALVILGIVIFFWANPSILKGIGNFFEGIWNFLCKVFGTIWSVICAVAKFIWKLLGYLWIAIRWILLQLWRLLKYLVQNLPDILSGLFRIIGHVLKFLWKAIKLIAHVLFLIVVVLWKIICFIPKIFKFIFDLFF